MSPATPAPVPVCGADENTGWSDETHIDGLDLPDESFDYGEFVQREFGPKKVLPRGINWFWWATAIVLVVLFVLVMIRFR